LHLTEARREEGLPEVSSWTGRTERAVRAVTDLKTDHMELPPGRASAIVCGMHGTHHDEIMEPVVEVGPPVRGFDPEREVPAEVPF
jgi:hypothetical protein